VVPTIRGKTGSPTGASAGQARTAASPRWTQVFAASGSLQPACCRASGPGRPARGFAQKARECGPLSLCRFGAREWWTSAGGLLSPGQLAGPARVQNSSEGGNKAGAVADLHSNLPRNETGLLPGSEPGPGPRPGSPQGCNIIGRRDVRHCAGCRYASPFPESVTLASRQVEPGPV
jgi:hypothetical protein